MEYFRISDRSNKRFHVGYFLIALPVICFLGCASFEHLTASGDQFAHAKECGKCHVAIYHEWAQSDHAKAFVNSHFRKATNDYAFEDCIGCHAPKPGLISEPPSARATDRAEGITCVSCHLKEGKLAGPVTPTGRVKPHPIEVDEEFYRISAICGGCHEGTQQEWNSVNVTKKTCQQCHMQPVTRKVTQAKGGVSNLIVAFEKEEMLRQHNFSVSVDSMSGKIVTIAAKRNGSLLTVQITNNLPHNLPTGDFGFRVLELQAIALDEQNREMTIGQRELAPELSSAIPARGELTWNVQIPPNAIKASIRLKRRSYDEVDVIVLAKVEVPF